MANYLTREDALGITPINGFKSCCAEKIKSVWVVAGGSMNVVRYEGECPVCKHYIGLTQTPQKEANDFLEHYHLNN